MYFQHDAALWRDFPALVPGVLYAEGITADAARSAVSPATRTVLIVAEALHEDAAVAIPELVKTLAAEIASAWPTPPQTAILTPASPRFTPRGHDREGF
jgi:hypothetical protein